MNNYPFCYVVKEPEYYIDLSKVDNNTDSNDSRQSNRLYIITLRVESSEDEIILSVKTLIRSYLGDIDINHIKSKSTSVKPDWFVESA